MNNHRITAEISTKDRYFTTLPLVLTSLANQTLTPHELLLFDDGEQIDLRQIDTYQHIFSLLDQKKIDWQVIFGKREGQVKNHQEAINIAKHDWIFRVDDDCVLEPNVLEQLASNIDDDIGAIGPLVIDPREVKSLPFGLLSNKINDVTTLPNIQWFKHDKNKEIKEVEHLYSCFLFNKNAAKHGYCMNLSPVGHKEETIFTYEVHRAGWKLIVDPAATVWHFRASSGGIRTYQDENHWKHDDFIFAEKMKLWDKNLSDKKLIILNCGLGDHCVFASILPEIKEKYEEIIIGACYPEVFEDEKEIEIISIHEAELMCNGHVDSYNVYKWMTDHDHKTSMADAFKGMYL